MERAGRGRLARFLRGSTTVSLPYLTCTLVDQPTSTMSQRVATVRLIRPSSQMCDSKYYVLLYPGRWESNVYINTLEPVRSSFLTWLLNVKVKVVLWSSLVCVGAKKGSPFRCPKLLLPGWNRAMLGSSNSRVQNLYKRSSLLQIYI